MASIPFDPSNITPPDIVSDVHGLYGRYLIQRHIEEKIKKETVPFPLPWSLPSLKPSSLKTDDHDGPVGILGAGVGGLYAAMILDSLDIPFEILEASDRTGGRVFTHEFSKKEHDYYDVGAMRFPDEPAMRRLFHLFRCHQLNSDDISVGSKLIPYYFESSGKNSFLNFNGISARESPDKVLPKDAFQFSDAGVPREDLEKGYRKIMEETFGEFVEKLKQDLENGDSKKEGWEKLMTQDKHSVRSYMALEKKIALPTVRWCETMDNSTDSYDKAFSEACLDIIAFGDDDTKWHCLDGGSQVLPNAMTDFIRRRRPNSLLLNKAVTGLRCAEGLQGGVDVFVKGEDKPRSYKHVISTIPLPVLRTLDIDNENLFTIEQRCALRQLSYGPSVKIGIKFKSQWWKDHNGPDGKPLNIIGGQSSSDRVIRTTVYPSYGVEGPNKTTVLIASYTWTSDAAAIGALVTNRRVADDRLNDAALRDAEDRLKDVVLRDLSHVHGVPLKVLEEEFVDWFSWDWQHHPLSQGAFAFFGPGQFDRLYRSLTQPAAKGYLHMAGEAISPRHAWIVGALDGSWRAVSEYLWTSGSKKIPLFKKLWGDNEEWVPSKKFKKLVPYAPIEMGGMEDEDEDEAESATETVEPDLLCYQLMAHGFLS